jgi:hypothetical protein
MRGQVGEDFAAAADSYVRRYLLRLLFLLACLP